MQVTMTVNDVEVTREIEGRLLLVHFLRDVLGLTGTHWGCDTSNCGTCVVWLDGEPVKSCTVLAAMAGGHEVRTVEGLAKNGTLDPVQEGFIRCHGLQCGFCTPGMLMTARALKGRSPDEAAWADAGQIAARSCAPVTDGRGTVDYKRHLADELTRRTLRTAVGRIEAGLAGDQAHDGGTR